MSTQLVGFVFDFEGLKVASKCLNVGGLSAYLGTSPKLSQVKKQTLLQSIHHMPLLEMGQQLFLMKHG